jgi:sugar phosphate isomerase/epimerase
MHPRLSVHTVGFGNCALAELAEPLAGAGIDRIGATMGQLERGGADANAAALRGAGVELFDVVEPLAFDLAEPATWDARRERLTRCLEIAATAGAQLLYLTTGPARGLDWDEAARRFAEAIAPVVETAAGHPVRLAVENTSTLRADLGFVHRVSDLIDLTGMAGVAASPDLYSAWNDRDLREAILRGGKDFAMVQVADFVLGTVSSPDRAVPGDGDIPLARQLDWLAESGFTGVIELELLGPRITAEGPLAAAERAVAVVTALL